MDARQHGLPVPGPCPSWCAGTDDISPDTGCDYPHMSVPETVTAIHGTIEARIMAWSPCQATAALPGFIIMEACDTELTAAQARQLAAALTRLADQLDREQ
jgi:hypothetical protein